jgi:glycosyltransferase involved in cell wall biosynthesis
VRKYDIIHTFSASYFSFILAPTPAILFAKLYRKKVLLNYHSGEADDHLTRWPVTAIPIIRLADEIAVPSEYLVQVFAKYGLLKPVFLSNRNLESHYGVDRVLRAFAIIQQSLPEASLTVAGDGSQRRALERLTSDLNLRQVEFSGQIDQDKVLAQYDAADIYLNGSEIDNQPLSLLEAFACGLPVVTTNAGGIPDIVTHERTGLMVRCGDYKALAREAIRLLNDVPLADHITTQALAECQKYSWPAVRPQWQELYEELAAVKQKAEGSRQKAVGRRQ